MIILFVRFRRFPLLCLLLCSLIAWPDSFPLEAMGPPRPVDPSATWTVKVLTGDSVNRTDPNPPLRWSRGISALEDGDDDETGRHDQVDSPMLGTMLAAGLFSLVPISVMSPTLGTVREHPPIPGNPPLRC